MSWPASSQERIIDGLLEIERIISNMVPGSWCNLECASALHKVACDAREARFLIRKLNDLPVADWPPARSK